MSDRRSETSAINGAKSKGPVTAEGKERSSQNALKHGLTAKKCVPGVMDNEDPAEWRAFLQVRFDTYRPDGPYEIDLVTRIAHAEWRQKRTIIMEDTLFSQRMCLQKHVILEMYPNFTLDEARTGLAFLPLAADGTIAAFTRYIAQIGREVDRATQAYWRHRENMAQLPPAAPKPVAATEPAQTEPAEPPSGPVPETETQEATPVTRMATAFVTNPDLDPRDVIAILRNEPTSAPPPKPKLMAMAA